MPQHPENTGTPKRPAPFAPSGFYEDDIAVGELRFSPWHVSCDNTTWIDGRLLDRSGTTVCQLDIGSTADSCCVTDDQRAAAAKAWGDGKVLAYRPYPKSPLALLVPDKLTLANVKTALDRFRA